MSEPCLPEESIFARVLELETSAQRAAFLDGACGDNQALRAGIEALLRAHDRSGDLLDLPENPAATLDEPIAERPGTFIGHYKLLEKIGEGGFGVVFMAEQQEPVRRKVALKVLKPGMDTRQVVARFEAERQALALMDHPNIAHVFDGGTTETGRPYFVMELVRGVPITEFCDQSCLAIRQRLELFVDVCQAVQHAHQKGIIHRDIKPTNVMVTLHDGTPVVKVIDFGIAKAMGQQLTEKTLFTNFAQLIGTPLYMSPEQAAMSGLDVDTRSDIYALGVLLYELLTGTTPFENERLSKVGYDEMRRIIREEEPPKPSTRISTVGKLATTACQYRQGDPRKLSRLFRGELDWIAMKALEKDRSRRYETANALALDVNRYLHDEPVLACPPSTWYRFRKFARRKKTALAMVACVLLALSAVTGGGGWLVRDRLARQWESEEKTIEILEATEPRLREGQPRDAALASAVLRMEALIESDTLGREVRRRAEQFLHDVRMLGELDEIRLRPAESKNGEMWDWGEAEKQYAAAFAAYGLDPAVEPAQAAAQVRQSPIHEALLGGLDAWLQLRKVQPAPIVASTQVPVRSDALPQPGEALDNVRTWLRAVADAADDNAWRRAVRETVLDGDLKKPRGLASDPETLKQPAHVLARLGSVLDAAGLHNEAETVLRQAQERYPGDFWINYNLGHLLIFDSPVRPDEAIGYFRAAVAIRPRSAEARSILGLAFHLKGDNERAIAEYQQAIALDPRYAIAHNNLGNALRVKGRLDESIAEHREALRLKPDFPHAHYFLALALVDKRQIGEPIEEFSQCLEMDPKNWDARWRRGNAYLNLGQTDKALADYSHVVRENPTDANAHNQLASLLATSPDAKVRDPRRAVELGKKAVELVPLEGNYWNTLGVAQYRAGDWKAAIEALEKSMELRSGGSSHDWFFLALAHWQLGDKEVARKWYSAAALWMDEYAPGDVQLRRFRDEAAALLGVTANQPRRPSGDADWEIWTLVREAQPDSVAARHWRGNKYGRLALWELAAAEFAKEFQFQGPPSARLWFLHALLRVFVGDAEGYRKIATQVPQHFQHESSNELGRALTLAPVPNVDLHWAAEQAELSVKNEGGAWSHNALGLVHYRAGEYEQSLGPLQDALRIDSHWRYAILSQSVLAMAYHRLGQAVEARQALTEADGKVDQWQESLLRLSSDPAGRTWWDLLEGLVLYREAKIMLEGSPPPDDPRPAVARAHAFAALGERDKAEEACRRAIADYSRAIELDQQNVFLWYCRALLRCSTSDREGYRKDCATMLERFGKGEDGATADWLVWTCVLAPEAVPDPAQVVQVAEKAVTNDPNNQACLNKLGAALYRAGRFDEAAKRLNETNAATPNPFTSPVYTWLFLAMTQHHLGHADEARQWLDKAVQAIDQVVEEPVQPDAEPSVNCHEIKAASPLSWNRALTFELLRREAQDLIKKPSTETGP